MASRQPQERAEASLCRDSQTADVVAFDAEPQPEGAHYRSASKKCALSFLQVGPPRWIAVFPFGFPFWMGRVTQITASESSESRWVPDFGYGSDNPISVLQLACRQEESGTRAKGGPAREHPSGLGLSSLPKSGSLGLAASSPLLRCH